MKVVSESRVTWATSEPILVFLGLSVLDLGPMYNDDGCLKRSLKLFVSPDVCTHLTLLSVTRNPTIFVTILSAAALQGSVRT